MNTKEDHWALGSHFSLVWGVAVHLVPPPFQHHFPACPSENHLNGLPYGSHPTLLELCCYTCGSLSLESSSWLILTHLSKLDSHANSPVAFPELFSMLSTFCVHISLRSLRKNLGNDLVSHTRCAQCEHNQCLVNKGNQFKWKVTNTGLWIAICFVLAHLCETVKCLKERNPRWFIFASFTQHLALCLVHSRC